MPDFPIQPTDVRAVLLHAVPFLLLLAAVVSGRPGLTARASWDTARLGASSALLLAIAGVTALAVDPAAGSAFASTAFVALIAFLAVVVVRFSATYLVGEARQSEFSRWLLATAGFAALVAATDHLLVVGLSWLMTSLSLQRLLTFYGERPAAQSAAREKFVVSRAADLCMAAAIVLLHDCYGTLSIHALVERASSETLLATNGHAAAVLIAAAVMLKTAQLPFHGWLLKVMEAPTPVSALLHAGVVNLGGLLLVRLGPVVLGSWVAETLLVVVGAATAGLAALVATTRVSIKVALAWSTCAQMGFLVMQCGLGLAGGAMLHLLAHSLYKAHAFLRAGSTVQNSLAVGMAPAVPVPGFGARGVAAAVAAALLLGVSSLLTAEPFADPFAEPGLLAAIGIAALALARPLAEGGLHAAVRFCGVAVLWCVLQRMLHAAVGAQGSPAAHSALLAAVAFGVFATLQAVRTALELHPEGRVARRLHALCYGGFYLVPWFSRLVLRLWPRRTQEAAGVVVPSLSVDSVPTHER